MIEPDEPIVVDSVGGFEGVKLSVNTCVTPPTTVVYTYGVTPFGWPIVGAGWPTGPCCTGDGVIVGTGVVVDVVVVVVVVAELVLVDAVLVNVCLDKRLQATEI
jgi:hypothetical protein